MPNSNPEKNRIDTDEIRLVLERIVDIQKKLTMERKAHGLTQKDVAKKLGWKQSEVSRFENSEVLPRIDTVMLYARCLGYDLNLVPLSEQTELAQSLVEASK